MSHADVHQLARRVGVTAQCKTLVFTRRRSIMAKAKSPIPEGFHTVTPQLTLDNAAQAIEWYKKALGAEEKSRAAGPDGKIMHAELRIGDSLIMVNDPMGGSKGPRAFGGSPISLWIYVDNADTLFNRAGAARGKDAGRAMGGVAGQRLRASCSSFAGPPGHHW